ncbi:conserved hypothetical protein [Sphingomonas sp. AX6]|nr:conserved hypothetical protein [Sphingomonas sp. AX6]
MDASALALLALAWILADNGRAERLLALTGLDADELRLRATDPSVLAATLAFLESHEPDLVACADAIGHPPLALVAARQRLEDA